MAGTSLAEAGWHMEAVIVGPAPGGLVIQPEVECSRVDAGVLPVHRAKLLVIREVRVQEDDGAGGPLKKISTINQKEEF